MTQRNSHCGYCGHPFDAAAPWPRTCAQCGQISYLNPLLVAVTLVPVDDGLLVVRRGIQPGRGQLALPGGYINHDETWQAACAREVREETGVTIDPALIRPFAVRSALHSVPDSSLLVFGLAPQLRQSELPPFQLDAETLEVLILNEPTDLAFSLHTAVVEEYFRVRGALAAGA